eukprot:7030735-Prymnesium_polylepis.1
MDANLISQADLSAILVQTVSLRRDIVSLANVSKPILIFDMWNHILVESAFSAGDAPRRLPSIDLHWSLSSQSYIQTSNISFATDTAWSLRAADAWLCGLAGRPPCSGDELLNITLESVELGYFGNSHPHWTIETNASMTRMARTLNTPELNAFGYQACDSGVCPDAITYRYHPVHAALANIWLMALPGGPVTVLSSYSWQSSFDGATGMDSKATTGPPRTLSGLAAPVVCPDSMAADQD